MAPPLAPPLAPPSHPRDYQPKSVRDGNPSSISALVHVTAGLEVEEGAFRLLVGQVGRDLEGSGWRMPEHLLSYEEWYASLGHHYLHLPAGRVANMDRLRQLYRALLHSTFNV